MGNSISGGGVVRALFAAILAVLPGVFGFVAAGDDGGFLASLGAYAVELFAAVEPRVQAAIVGVLLFLLLIPQIASLTPWTWDDVTIRYKGAVVKVIARAWNDLAGNHGKASNGGPGGIGGG